MNIKEVEDIFKEEEQTVTERAKDSHFAETNSFFDKIRHLNDSTLSDIIHRLNDYGNTGYRFNSNLEDKISTEPTHTFIRALASGDQAFSAIMAGSKDMPEFQEYVNQLVGNNSQLIDYVIARNPNVTEETRIKIAQKKNVDPIILAELAKTTKSVTLLEALIGNDDGTTEYDNVKIAVLNNPVFNSSEKSNEIFSSCLEQFSIEQLISLTNIPEICKEDYDYFMKLKNIEARMSYESEKMIWSRDLGEDDVYEYASSKYNALQEEYNKLKSQRIQK